MEEKEMGSPNEGETSMSLTYLHVNQLKHAWQCEHDDLVAEKEVNGKLRESIEYMKMELEGANTKVDIERARADLGVLSTCNPGRPDILVDSIVEILPRPNIAGLTQNDPFMRLTCCIRSDRWVVIGSDRAVDDYYECNEAQTKNLDDLAHDLSRAQYHRLSEVGLSSGVAKELLSFLSSGQDYDGDMVEMLSSSFVLPVFPRCLWFVQPPPAVDSGSRPIGVTVTDMDTLLEAEDEAKSAEFESVKARQLKDNLGPVSEILANGWFSILETASQLTMASYIQKIAANDAVSVDVTQTVTAAVCAHLFSSDAYAGTDIDAAEERLRTLPAALEDALRTKERDFDVGIFAIMNNSANANASADADNNSLSSSRSRLQSSSRSNHQSRDVSVVSCSRFDVWRLFGADTEDCLACSALLQDRPLFYQPNLQGGAQCIPDIDLDGKNNADTEGGGVFALAIPVLAPTVFKDRSLYSGDNSGNGNGKNGGASDSLKMGFSVVLRSSSRHHFTRLERRNLTKAVQSIAAMLKAYVQAHRAVFNPLSSCVSVLTSVTNSAMTASRALLGATGSHDHFLTGGSGSENKSNNNSTVGSQLLACLRQVLDEQPVSREDAFLSSLKAFAVNMPAHWFLAFEVGKEDGTSAGSAKLQVFVPPHLTSSANGEASLPVKAAVDPSTLLQGGLRDFFQWLLQAPAVTPSTGEAASHFLSAARVEHDIDVVGDGLLHLLEFDYYGGFRDADGERSTARGDNVGSSDATSMRHKLLHHLAAGATPVYGARIDCYRHTDVDTNSSLEVASGRDREDYTHSLVILSGTVHSAMSLPEMVAKTGELTNFLDMLSTVGDLQVILDKYSAFHDQLGAITSRVSVGDVLNRSQLALSRGLQSLAVSCNTSSNTSSPASEEKDSGGSALRLGFLEVVRAYLVEVHDAMEGGAGDGFDASSVSVVMQESLAQNAPRSWRVDDRGHWVYVSGGAAIQKGERSVDLHRQALPSANKSAADATLVRVSSVSEPDLSVRLTWKGPLPSGKLETLQSQLHKECKSFVSCHLASFLRPSGNDAAYARAGDATRDSLVSRAVSLECRSGGGVGLGCDELTVALRSAHPLFSCVPVAVPFEGYKAVYLDQHKDQTTVEYRLCKKEEEEEKTRRLAALHRETVGNLHPQSAFANTLVHDLRRADELALGEESPSLPSLVAAAVGKVAQLLLPSTYPSASDSHMQDQRTYRERTAEAACRVLAKRVGSDGETTVTVLLHLGANGTGEIRDYLRYPQSTDLEHRTLQTAEDCRDASRAVSADSRVMLVLRFSGPSSTPSASLGTRAQAALYGSPDGSVYRHESYVMHGYLAVVRSEEHLVCPADFIAIEDDLTRLLGAYAAAATTKPALATVSARGHSLPAASGKAVSAVLSAAIATHNRNTDAANDDGDVDVTLAQLSARRSAYSTPLAAAQINAASLSKEALHGVLRAWQTSSIALMDSLYQQSHDENSHCSRAAVYCVVGSDGISEDEAVAAISSAEQPPLGLVGSDGVLSSSKQLQNMEKAMAAMARVPVSQPAGYCSTSVVGGSDSTSGLDVMVESCLAPEAFASSVLPGSSNSKSNIAATAATGAGGRGVSRNQRPVTHYVRLSITGPAQYLSINATNANAKGTDGSSEGGANDDSKVDSKGAGRVVLASLLLWFDGFSLRLPASAMQALLHSAVDAAGLVAGHVLNWLSHYRVVSALRRCLVNAVVRGLETRAGAATVRAQVSRLLEVVHSQRSKDGPADSQTSKEITVACQVLGLTSLHSTLSSEDDSGDNNEGSDVVTSWEAAAMESIIPAALTDIAAATADLVGRKGASALVGPYSQAEAASLHLNSQAVKTVTNALATALANLADEKRNVGALRHQMASLKVRAREERDKSTAFLTSVETLLLGPGGSLHQHHVHTPAQAQALAARRQQQQQAWLVYDGHTYDRIRTLMEATSELTAKLLSYCSFQTQREDASHLAVSVAGETLLRGMHHQALLQDLPDGTYSAVSELLRREMCVWIDGRGPPGVLPPMKNLLRPDLLLAAWQSGLRTRGPIPENLHIAFGLLNDQGDISDGTGEAAQLVVEYIPVLQPHHHQHPDHHKHHHHHDNKPQIASSRVYAAFPVAVVQHVTLLGRGDTAATGGNTLQGDERYRSEDDDSDGGEDTDNKAHAAATDDMRKWLQSTLAHLQISHAADGQLVTTHGLREAASWGKLLTTSEQACDDILALRALIDGGGNHHKEEDMRDLLNIHQTEDWRDFCEAAADFAATKLKGTVTFLYPHLASAGFHGERDDDDSDSESSYSSSSSSSSSGSEKSVASDGSKTTHTTHSSVDSDDDDTYVKKQRQHDRETWLQLTGCRSVFTHVLTQEDVDEHADIKAAAAKASSPTKVRDGGSAGAAAAAAAGGTAEDISSSVVIISRSKLSELCESAEENGHVVSFGDDSCDIYGPLDVKHLFHSEEAEHHVLVISFLVDPIDKRHHHSPHSGAAVHRQYLNGIKRLRWTMVLQCDRVVSPDDIAIAHSLASTLRTLITHRTLLTIQATLSKHMSELDTMMETRTHHSQQMADIWRFTDKMSQAVKIVSHDTSAAIRRLVNMIATDMPSLVGATSARLVASDSEGEERGDDSHHAHGKHHHKHKEHDYARMCVETNSIVLQRTYTRHHEHANGLDIADGTDVGAGDGIDKDDGKKRNSKSKRGKKGGQQQKNEPKEHVYYWVPVLQAKLCHISPNAAVAATTHHDEDEQEHVYWALCVQAPEDSPLGRALHLQTSSAAAVHTADTTSDAIAAINRVRDPSTVHVGAELEYSEVNGNTKYENLCFILKEIRNNVNIVALQRSSDNVDRHNRWTQKVSAVVNAAVGAVGSLHQHGLSLPKIARTVALEITRADTETRMCTAHHGHHHEHGHHHDHNHTQDDENKNQKDGSDSDSDSSSSDEGAKKKRKKKKTTTTTKDSSISAAGYAARGGASEYGGGMGKELDSDSFHADTCSVRARLHWLADVPQGGSDASAYRPGSAAAGVGMAVHFNMQAHKKRWLSTVDDAMLQELSEIGTWESWDNAADEKLGGSEGEVEGEGGHRRSKGAGKRRSSKSKRSSRKSHDSVFDSQHGVEEEKELDEDQRAIERLEGNLARMISHEHGTNVHNVSLESNLRYVSRSCLGADRVQTALGKDIEHSHTHVTTIASGLRCAPAILRHQHHHNFTEHHRHSQAHVHSDFGTEIGAHIDEADNDDHKYEHDHILATVYLDVSTGRSKALLEVRISYCPHSLFPLNHAGMHESGHHITSFLRQCVTQMARAGPLMTLAWAVRRTIRAVDVTRQLSGYTLALSDALGETRNNVRVVNACLRELCIDQVGSDTHSPNSDGSKPLPDETSDVAEKAAAEGRASKIDDNEEDIDPDGSINQKIRRIHDVFNSILDRLQLQLLHLNGCLGVVVTAWDTSRALELYKKCAEVNSDGIACVSEGAVGRFNNEKDERYQYLGTTSEYSYECGEIRGVVSIYWKNSDEQLARKFRIASAVGDDAVAAIEAERKYHEEETAHLMAHLVQAVARRLFELVRGGRLQQIMVVQQRHLVEARGAEAILKRRTQNAESNSKMLEKEMNQLEKDNNALMQQLRVEKQVNLEALDANKKLADKTAHITQAVRSEHQREVDLMRNVYEKEKELLELDVGQREAVIKLLREGSDPDEVEAYERELRRKFFGTSQHADISED